MRGAFFLCAIGVKTGRYNFVLQVLPFSHAQSGVYAVLQQIFQTTPRKKEGINNVAALIEWKAYRKTQAENINQGMDGSHPLY